jgi:hypothetical protein
VKSCLRDLGFEEADHELAKKLQAPVLENGAKLEQISDLVISCTSAETFYENKNGKFIIIYYSTHTFVKRCHKFVKRCRTKILVFFLIRSELS